MAKLCKTPELAEAWRRLHTSPTATDFCVFGYTSGSALGLAASGDAGGFGGLAAELKDNEIQFGGFQFYLDQKPAYAAICWTGASPSVAWVTPEHPVGAMQLRTRNPLNALGVRFC